MKKIKKYKKFMKGQSDQVWYDECTKNKIYVISIREEKAKNFKVQWDHLSLDIDFETNYLDKELHHIISTMHDKIYNIISVLDKKQQKKIIDKSYITPFSGWVKEINEDLAIKIAEELSIYLNGLVDKYNKNNE